jgi:hypothetical protein
MMLGNFLFLCLAVIENLIRIGRSVYLLVQSRKASYANLIEISCRNKPSLLLLFSFLCTQRHLIMIITLVTCKWPLLGLRIRAIERHVLPIYTPGPEAITNFLLLFLHQFPILLEI